MQGKGNAAAGLHPAERHILNVAILRLAERLDLSVDGWSCIGTKVTEAGAGEWTFEHKDGGLLVCTSGAEGWRYDYEPPDPPSEWDGPGEAEWSREADDEGVGKAVA
jgi:hypothetical protein